MGAARVLRMRYLDLLLILKNRGYQIIHGDTPWSSVEMVKLASDIFSTFLGYRYLDAPTSVLYHYPLPVWIFSLVASSMDWNWHWIPDKHPL